MQKGYRNLCLAVALFPPANPLLSFKDILPNSFQIDLTRVLILDDALFNVWFDTRICAFL